MTQQIAQAKAIDRAWDRMQRSDWDQVAWFTRLANAELSALSDGELLNLKDEFLAIHLEASWRSGSAEREATKAKRYWKPDHHSDQIPAPPSLDNMREVQVEAVRMLTDLAQGRDTSSPWIHEDYRVSFRKTSPEREKLGAPRYEILRGSIGQPQSAYASLIMWLTRLLERYADNIRQCLHCNGLFIQNKKSARYCGQACYSVASMREFRKREAAKAAEGQYKKKIRRGKRNTPRRSSKVPK